MAPVRKGRTRSKGRARRAPARRKEALPDELSLERFIPHLVHALRNSLSSLKLAVQTASDLKSPPERGHKSLTLAAREIDRLDRTLAIALELARPGFAAGEPGSTVHLEPLVAQALNAVGPELQARAVEVVRSHPVDPLPSFTGNPGRLRLCLECLITAMARSMPGGGRVTIELTGQPGFQRIEIRDGGPALNPEEREGLFQPLARSVRSSGLDLPMVERVTRDMGGSLQATNLAGGGVSMRWLIPNPAEGR